MSKTPGKKSGNPWDAWQAPSFEFADLIAGLWRGGPRRRQVFEPGQMRLVILKLLEQRPRHGYDIIKALEELFQGSYTPSAGTVYPTLQLLEDQKLVAANEENGRRTFTLSATGALELSARKKEVDEIFERAHAHAQSVTKGSMGELRDAFGRLARVVFQGASWAPSPKVLREVAQLLERTAQEAEQLYRDKK